MRTWKIAAYALRCGAQPQCVIPKGDPYLELGRESWKVKRCASHADEAVPPVINGEEIQPVAFTSLRQLVKSVERFDPKMAAAGRDD